MKAKKQIYLFNTPQQEWKQNSLKEFIYFLRFFGSKGVIDFSYASAFESTHPKLSIKDNFILDSVPTSLIKNKEDNLKERINKLNNKVLIDLINDLESIDRKTSQLNLEEQKLCSIVKSLLSSSEYIFLESPDLGLSQKTLKKIKKSLLFEVEHNNRIVFIHAKNNNSWLDIATNIVTKKGDGKYQYSSNPLVAIPENKVLQQKNVIRISEKSKNDVKELKTNPKQAIYNFSLLKKAS